MPETSAWLMSIWPSRSRNLICQILQSRNWLETAKNRRSGEANLTFVYAEALDRISRDQEDVAGVYKRLRFADVRIITLAEGEISELHVGLKGTMNALFLTDLANKTRRGLRGRVEAGRSGGGLTYGYDVVRTPRADGTVEVGDRRINEAEAEVVRRIFREYVAGQSPRAIALSLNRDGIAGPRGRGWGASTINGNAARGTGILNNRIYIGKLVWNKLRYVKDPDTRKRRSKVNKAEAVIEKDVPHLQIIEQDLWNAVKQRQAEVMLGPQSTKTRPWDRRRPRYMLSGLVKCGALRWRLRPDQQDASRLCHRAQQGHLPQSTGD